MKLGSIHLFMLFLFFLIVAPLVSPLVEGMEGMSDNKKDYKKKVEEDEKWDNNAYMLKSQMVPPVCPACPQKCDKEREKPCPPCPPCARCPEPNFECKKVPKYNVALPGEVDKYLPKPILTDFSRFDN
tara:strand:- start:58 stop:441 length:384 start_codon:yes stop_codon:yes gene_type:complete